MTANNDEFKVAIICKDFSVQTRIIPGQSLGTQVEYPSDWFKKNTGQKPHVLIPKQINDLEVWEKMLGACRDGALDSRIVVRHVYDFMVEHINERLNDKWTSYGVTIGNRGDQVSPINLLDVQISEDDWHHEEGEKIDEDGQLRLFVKFLMGYRFGLASDAFSGDYKNTILRKMNSVVKEEPFSFTEDIGVGELGLYKNWYNNPEFRVLIAALDMF